jgi:8-oxo-dGTP pyrophosphatase MutT (NUDIX family)
VSPFGISSVRVESVDLVVDDRPLVLSAVERAAIEAGFDAARTTNPALWNGAFYLFDAVDTAVEGCFAARARATDFATFLHWRAAAEPDPRFTHVFPVAAVTTADDRLLVGVMGPATANPGRIYPPAGSFDPTDATAGRLDPVANMVRELKEEVGLDIAAFPADPGYTVYASGPRRFALVKRWRAPGPSADYAASIATHVAEDPEQELAGFRFLDFDEQPAAAITVGYVGPLLADLAAGRS